MPMLPLPPLHWKAELWLRMRRLFALKLIGTTAFTSLFFVAYFELLRHPAFPVVTMPVTALDRLVPFQPAMLYAYLSLWVYVGVAPGLQRSFRELVMYGVWVSGLCVAGLAIFYAWPTAVPSAASEGAGSPGFQMLQGVDAAGNACPSMHVAVAMFTALWIDRLFRDAATPPALRFANLAWFVAIAWSTLAIRQHVVFDVAAGALLGVAFALPSLHWRAVPRRVVGATGADIIKRLPSDVSP